MWGSVVPPRRGQHGLAGVPGLDVVAAALTGLFVLAGVLASSQDLFGSGTDLVTTEYPLAAFATAWMKRGVLPQWDPFLAGGVPFPAATKGFFYPPFWLGLVVSVATSFKVTCALHLALAGAGAAWLARPHVQSRWASYLAGALFATSGFFAAHLYAGHVELVEASAYIPWIVGVADRARSRGRLKWSAAALCMGLALLAGHYQMVAIGALGAVLFASAEVATGEGVGRERLASAARGLGVFGSVLLLGALVAAVQLVPAARVLAFTQRAAPDASFTASFAAAPLSFLAMLTPDALGRDAALFQGTFAPWEACAYVGVVPLALAAYAIAALPRARWLPALVVATVAALLALGDATPLLGWLSAIVPPFAHFRAPGRYLVLVALFVTQLAALGLDAFVAAPHEPARGRVRFAPLVILALVFVVATFAQTTSPESFARLLGALAPIRSTDSAAWTGVLAHVRDDAFLALLFLGAGVGTLVLGVAEERRYAAVRLLVALAVADPLYAAQPYLGTAPHAAFEPLAPLVPHLASAMPLGGRILPTPDLVQPNLGVSYDLATLSGYTIFLDDRYARFAKRALGIPADAFITVVQPTTREPLFRHLGVDLVLTSLPLADREGHAHLALGDAHRVGGMGRVQVLAMEAPVPRAFVSHAVEVIPEEDATYARMESPAFDVTKVTLLEAPDTFPMAAPDAGAKESARITVYEPNRVVLEVDAAAPGVLVLSDVYEPGWTAEVDGVGVDIVPANRVMRAVPVAAGHHEVVMRYVAPGFVLGERLSVVGIVLVLLLAGFEVWRARKKNARAPPGPKPGDARDSLLRFRLLQ